MRSLLLLADMMFLLPFAVYRPFVGVLAFDMISFLNPQQISWGIGSSPPWALLAFFATMAGWMATRTEPKQIPLTKMNILIILFMIGITINMPFALAPFAIEFDMWSRVMKIFVFLLITSALTTDRQRVDALVWVILISLGYYIIDQGGIAIITAGHHKAFGPPKSQIGDNNEFAAAILVVVPLMNYVRLQSRYAIIRAGVVLATALGVLTSLTSYSRGALLGLVTIAFFIWLRSKHKVVSLVVVGIGLAIGLHFMPDSWWERMDTIQHYQGDSSAVNRLYIWAVAFKLALMHPLTGVGFHATDYQNVIDLVDPGGHRLEIHSIWFQIIGEQGFVVATIWLMMTVTSIFAARSLIRMGKASPEFTWAADLGRMGQISIIAYLVSGTFLPISCWDIYFTILTIICAAQRVVAHQLAAQQPVITPVPRRPTGRMLPQPGFTRTAGPVGAAGQVSRT